jgi:hypothetical protein
VPNSIYLILNTNWKLSTKPKQELLMKRIISLVLYPALVCLFAASVSAADIGKITKFEGKVLVMAGDQIKTVDKVNFPISSGDKIQTDKGEVEITFTDGALLRIRPFTLAGVEERQEEKGVFFWKKKEDARRVTDMVGKVWFKSGNSDKKNYLQTPTAVCALRGTDGDLGYDGNNSFLNLYAGEADVRGQILRQAFGDFAQNIARNSSAYQAITRAVQIQQAAQAGNRKSAREAQMGISAAIRVAAEAMQNNPDPLVRQFAAVTMAVSDARIAAVQSQQIAEDAAAAAVKAQQALATAQQAGNVQAVAVAQANLEAVQALATQAAQTAQQATSAAQAAFNAISGGNVGNMAEAQTVAQQVVEQVATLVQDVVALNIVPPPPPVVLPPPTTIPPPTDIPPTELPPTTELPTTEPPPVPTIYEGQ